MWNNSGFGGNNDPSKKSGGGFMASSPGNFGSPSASFSQADKKGKGDAKTNNIIPCTVGRIHKLESSEDHIKIGSLSSHIITLVGVVSHVEDQSTKVLFELDDLTGPPLPVQLWIGDEPTPDTMSNIVESCLVRVYGTLRTIQDKRQIIAFKIMSVADVNELTMHLLEVIHVGMAITIMDNPTAPMDMSTNANNSNAGDTDIPQAGGGMMVNGLNPQQNLVLQAIAPSIIEDGISLDQLCIQLKSLPRATIRNIVEFLSTEGHIYSTIDDEHYKATDAM